jgi:peptide/nickel transport system permease protein
MLRRYVLTKILGAIPVMAVVGVVSFLLIHLAPGDPAILLAGELASNEAIEQIRHSHGFDQPLYVQLWIWSGQLLQGDLGTSIFSHVPVTQLMAQRLEPTLLLALMTIALSIIIGIPLGVIAGARARTTIDRGVMAFSVLGFSVPTFILAYCLIYVFSLQLRWFPVQGYRGLAEGLWPAIRSLLLPTVALSTTYIALIARITRTSMIDILGEDYIRSARAKGVPNIRLHLVHALRNASVPIVTVIGIGIAALISGVVITETVFNLPGIGRLLVDGIVQRDYVVIQAMLVVFSGVYVVINLTIDVVYGILDPRIRY